MVIFPILNNSALGANYRHIFSKILSLPGFLFAGAHEFFSFEDYPRDFLQLRNFYLCARLMYMFSTPVSFVEIYTPSSFVAQTSRSSAYNEGNGGPLLRGIATPSLY